MEEEIETETGRVGEGAEEVPRREAEAEGDTGGEAAAGRRGQLKLFSSAPVDWLVVGLGNPGSRYDGTPHNVGFQVADALLERWDLPKPRKKFAGELTEGRTGPGGPRVAVLKPQTYMNEAGRSVGPARGSYRLDLDRVLVIHDEIDLPFGDIRVRLGGGLAGHNGLKSLQRELGGADFHRVRVGVGPPGLDGPRHRRRRTCSGSGASRPPTCATSSSGPATRPSASCSATAPSDDASPHALRRRRDHVIVRDNVQHMTKPRDWDASTYERLSAPLAAMGVDVLDRLELAGDETVLDAGCGTGKVTQVLYDRLPRGRVIAVDAAPSMVEQARALLPADVDVRRGRSARPGARRAGGRGPLDRHVPLDRRPRAAVRQPARRAQAGRPPGRPVRRRGQRGDVKDAGFAAASEPPFAEHLAGWPGDWNFATPEDTERRLRAAGFTDVWCWLSRRRRRPRRPRRLPARDLPRLVPRAPARGAARAVPRRRRSRACPTRSTIHYVRLNILAAPVAMTTPRAF